MRLVVVVLFGLALLQGWTSFAAIFPKVDPSRVEEFFVKTREDGVDLKVYHLSNPGKPIILLMHGFTAQGLSLEVPATRFFERGFDVYVGNVRGAVNLPDGMKLLARDNGLVAITRYDFPAILRGVLERATPEQLAYGVTLFGHSRGGMSIASTLTAPKLREEFQKHIRAAVLLQSPLEISDLKWYLDAISKVGGLQLLELLQAHGVELVDHHSRLLTMSKEAKEVGGMKGRVLLPAVESFVMQLTKAVLNPVHMGRDIFRRAFYKMPAWGIPVDELRDFLMAKRNGGHFYDHEGKPLIDPAALKDLPFMVIASTRDTLASHKRNYLYFKRIASRIKQFMTIDDMNHVESVLSTRRELDFTAEIERFIRNPELEARLRPEFEFEPRCETLLTKAQLFFRKVTRVRDGI